ncbi:hypothetical protein QVD17_09513 [Tagetes erecta]|uniref:Uncharacterized protein n=1 Tax=Tagetes erecta TaxID=13708 RepID=A0AAD8NYJ6_TARER|nr:hypothetical protein QVD17_09513 [Tagetes erecta]
MAGTGMVGSDHRCGDVQQEEEQQQRFEEEEEEEVEEEEEEDEEEEEQDEDGPRDGMVVAPSMVGVLGDGMVDKMVDRCNVFIGGLLGDEGDGMDHPPHPKGH